MSELREAAQLDDLKNGGLLTGQLDKFCRISHVTTFFDYFYFTVVAVYQVPLQAPNCQAGTKLA